MWASTIDLTFNVLQREQGVGVAIEYYTDLFEPGTVAWRCGSFLIVRQMRNG